MVKQQVNVKILIAEFQMRLPAHKGKSLAELQKKFFYVFNQLLFKISFSTDVSRAKKIKDIWIFKYLIGHVTVYRRQSNIKIICGLANTLMQLRFNLKNKNVSAPAIFSG